MPNTPESAIVVRNGAGTGLRPEPAATLPTDVADQDEEPARLRLKPPGPRTGRVDGVWWPPSDDLAAEAPALIAAAADRIGPVETITYPLSAWESVPRRIIVNGARLRLGGYRWQEQHTIDLFTARQRLTLLVVPPASTAQDADRAFTAVLDDDGTRTAEELLG